MKWFATDSIKINLSPSQANADIGYISSVDVALTSKPDDTFTQNRKYISRSLTRSPAQPKQTATTHNGKKSSNVEEQKKNIIRITR